jgi:hypothetical protein
MVPAMRPFLVSAFVLFGCSTVLAEENGPYYGCLFRNSRTANVTVAKLLKLCADQSESFKKLCRDKGHTDTQCESLAISAAKLAVDTAPHD